MLQQSDADNMRTMPKRLLNPASIDFPSAGDARTFEAESLDGRDKFLIDANRRGRIRLAKCTYQERHSVVIVLARLDVGGPDHDNPRVDTVPLPNFRQYNGAAIPCPHLHIYIVGWDIKWAVPAPVDAFPRMSDLALTLSDFMGYCGIADPPECQAALL
ncbi:MAG: hypothetical protein IID37_06415 [Planctomycetes bacterium]|nr:hypothetical protein [Planctomycetota bacterium]